MDISEAAPPPCGFEQFSVSRSDASRPSCLVLRVPASLAFPARLAGPLALPVGIRETRAPIIPRGEADRPPLAHLPDGSIAGKKTGTFTVRRAITTDITR